MYIRRLSPLLALLFAACGPTPADRKNLADAYAAYASHDFIATESHAGAYIQNQPTADNVDQAFYLRGLARYGRGDRADAAADLQKALEHTQRPDLKYKANMTLGDIAFDQNHWDEAAADYQKAIAAAGKSAAVEPRLEFRLGVALQSVGQWDNARPYLAAVAASPDVPLAQRARERLNAHAFSIQFGAFRDNAHATELARQLHSAGLAAAAINDTHNGQPVYVVRFGSFTTLADAEIARKRLAPRYPAVAIVP